MPDKVVCNFCGIDIGTEDSVAMTEHLLLNHPLEMLDSPKVRRGIFNMAEELGGKLAELLRRK